MNGYILYSILLFINLWVGAQYIKFNDLSSTVKYDDTRDLICPLYC